MAAALPFVQVIGGVLGAVGQLGSLFGGGPEEPELPPPPPAPEPLSAPPPPKQVSEDANEALAAEQARTRSIRQRRQDTRRKGLTSLAAKEDSSLLGD